MKNRFYNWIARQILIESWEGQLTRSVTIRICFRGIIIALYEYKNDHDRIKLIQKNGELK